MTGAFLSMWKMCTHSALSSRKAGAEIQIRHFCIVQMFWTDKAIPYVLVRAPKVPERPARTVASPMCGARRAKAGTAHAQHSAHGYLCQRVHPILLFVCRCNAARHTSQARTRTQAALLASMSRAKHTHMCTNVCARAHRGAKHSSAPGTRAPRSASQGTGPATLWRAAQPCPRACCC